MALSLRPEQCRSGFFFLEKSLRESELCIESRRVDGEEGEGVVTAPINKQSTKPVFLATLKFSELTHSEEALTMFQVKSLSFFTRHLPKIAIEQVKR